MNVRLSLLDQYRVERVFKQLSFVSSYLICVMCLLIATFSRFALLD